jgi:hypothetical protein
VERRDYLLRMLEEMGRVVARVRELVTGQSVAAAAEELERAASLAGVTLPLVRALSGDGLTAVLTTAGRPDPAKHLLAAEYLYLEALRATAPEAEALFGRALSLYRAIGPLRDPALQDAVADRIADLERRTAATHLPTSGGTLR